MGQKVNPHGLRVGIIRGWDSVWYADKDFGDFLVEDDRIRKFIKKKLFAAGIAKITIHRTSAKCNVTIHTARPGVVIGRSGQAIGELTEDIQKMLKVNKEQRAFVYIEEVRAPELNAQLVAEDIAKQLENRVTFRRAMRGAMTKTMKMGAKGIKTATSGRLGGADIARGESYHEGTIPLQTLRADIDYGFAEAATAAGRLGVKVWIYRGEVFDRKAVENPEPPRSARRDGRPGGDRRRNDRPRGDRPGGSDRPRGPRLDRRPGGPGGYGGQNRPPRPAGEQGRQDTRVRSDS
ncbi:MAG: 30S ribosomal protein S3 [Clostridiales bacterium]|jgi:small subunit ribosomal protein S3|nr:30S ribosomal protein S3 [Clostridiales bacterium]